MGRKMLSCWIPLKLVNVVNFFVFVLSAFLSLRIFSKIVHKRLPVPPSMRPLNILVGNNGNKHMNHHWNHWIAHAAFMFAKRVSPKSGPGSSIVVGE